MSFLRVHSDSILGRTLSRVFSLWSVHVNVYMYLSVNTILFAEHYVFSIVSHEYKMLLINCIELTEEKLHCSQSLKHYIPVLCVNVGLYYNLLKLIVLAFRKYCISVIAERYVHIFPLLKVNGFIFIFKN